MTTIRQSNPISLSPIAQMKGLIECLFAKYTGLLSHFAREHVQSKTAAAAFQGNAAWPLFLCRKMKFRFEIGNRIVCFQQEQSAAAEHENNLTRKRILPIAGIDCNFPLDFLMMLILQVFFSLLKQEKLLS